MRTEEETFIIVHLLKKNASDSPILNGNLEQLALLACSSSPHVVKRALDALLDEIFLSISDFQRVRCHNMLQAEKIIRESFHKLLKVDHSKAKCQRMTTYAWLITFILLKYSKEECAQIATEIAAFDKTLDTLLKENIERNTFRYGIQLARETIKRIVVPRGRKNPKESIQCSIERCANILNSKLDENEVMKLGKALNDEGSWLNLHVCLVFLQDLPKLHQFQGNLKPIFLIQMLIQDYRDRCSGNKFRNWRALRMASSEPWRFEILVYHVMLRLIRTSGNDDAITEQVLSGRQGCGGVFNTWSESKPKTTRDFFIMENLEKICKRVVFRAPPICFEQLITCIGNGDEQNFIEDLAILRLSSQYKDRVLDILPKSDVRRERQHVSTYDALMNGKKCVLKLYRHSKEEILKATGTPKTDPLRKEIEVVKVLNALAEPCPNLVQLLGSSIEAPMHMIIERGFKGDLQTFLDKQLNITEAQSLVQIALDICSAMIFIHRQNIIHRDLRAKNCFVFTQDGKLLAKIGDFHLATIAYSTVPRLSTNFKQRNNSTASMNVEDILSQFTVPWMAVETLQFGEFSTASDVWSYGVLLFEIFTLGSPPYVNMPSGRSLNSDEDVRNYVTSGNRLELHPKIPQSIQDLIQSTMVDADHRPTFSYIRDNLLGMKFADETYVDSSYFQISHDYENPSADIIDRPVSASTGCTANSCVGECLIASDVAVPVNDGDNFIKEFVPVSSRDILRLSELECPSLAIITAKIFHDEKLELVTEIGDMGSLKQFINAYGCSMENAMSFLLQIGEGVMFLHNRRFIHRNLRADSVFVYSNGNAKLACFARVRRLKPNADDQSCTIPINLPMPDDSLRWSSPQVMSEGEYSKASDMWAFGVMIWEMFTLIDKEIDESDEEIIPYHQLSSKEQILSYLRKEKRLGKPNNCPDWLYEMMLRCWENNTQDRVKVQDIVQCIHNKIPRNDHTS